MNLVGLEIQFYPPSTQNVCVCERERERESPKY